MRSFKVLLCRGHHDFIVNLTSHASVWSWTVFVGSLTWRLYGPSPPTQDSWLILWTGVDHHEIPFHSHRLDFNSQAHTIWLALYFQLKNVYNYNIVKPGLSTSGPCVNVHSTKINVDSVMLGREESSIISFIGFLCMSRLFYKPYSTFFT